jgi:hypothetical protein
MWVESELEWYMHGLHHLKNPPVHSGIVMIRGLVASAGQCPFCLEQGFYRQFTEPYFIEHVNAHMATLSEAPFTCPHPNCNTNFPHLEELGHHLQEIHGIKQKVKKRQRE